MSDEIFSVGFGVDTSQLQNAKTVSIQMAKALEDMAGALEKQEKATIKSADADAKKTIAQREAAEAAKKATDAHKVLVEAEKAATEAVEKARLAAEGEKAALEAAAKAAKEKADAAKVTADAATKQAAATRIAADEAAKKASVEAQAARQTSATAEEVRKHIAVLGQNRTASAAAGEAMAGMGAKAQTVAGHVGALTQGILNAGQAMQSGGGLGAGIGAAAQGLSGLGGAIGGVTGGFLAMGAGVATTAAAIGTLIAVTGKQQEAFLLIEGRLANVYGSAAKAAEVFGRLTDLADKNGVAIEATADAFLRVARNNEAIGLTTDELLQMTDAVQKLGRVSGSTQDELAGAMVQFSQSLAAGRLNGDELRSIMENMPALAKAIADGLGVSVGQLRAMGAAGELTGDKVTGAILKQLPEIQKEFESLPQTSEQAFQRVGNAWDKLLANMGQQLKSNDILTWFGNTVAAVVEAGANATKAETNQAAILRLSKERENGGPSWTIGATGGLGAPIPADVVNSDVDKQLQEALDKRRSNAMEKVQAAFAERIEGQRAPFVRGEVVAKEVDDYAKKVAEITSNIKALEGELEALQDRNGPFTPVEVARISKTQELIAALKSQLATSLPVLDEYRAKTARMMDGILKYGDAAGIMDEADALAKSMAAKGQAVLRPDGSDGTYDAAVEAVLARRTAGIEQQTQAMSAQILTQQLMTDAVGKGTAAQLEAEVQAKALEVQTKTFGDTLDGDARAAMDRYTAALREQMQAQQGLTEAQKLFNTELQLGIERQVTAAIRAGATAEEVARLRQSLSLGQNFGQAMGGPAAGVIMGSGAGSIPVNLQSAFDAASAASGIPVQVLAAMAKQESGFNPSAVSPTGALGVMQILPSTAADPGYGVAGIAREDLADPSKNIMFGAQYFAARAKSAGLDVNTPDGLAQALRLYNGSDQPMGDKAYAENVMRYLPTGAQSVVAQGEIQAEQAAQTAGQRINQLEIETRRLREQATAQTKSGSISAQRQAAIDDDVKRFDPAEQEKVRAALVAKARAEEQASIQEQIRAQEESIDLERKKAEIAKLPARERQIELAVLDEINQAKARGNTLDQEQIDRIRENATRAVDLDLESATKSSREKFEEVWTTTAQAIGSALEGSMRSAIMTGKVDAESVLKGLVADIATSIMRAYITQPLVSGMTSLFAAHGTAVSGGNVIPFASGGVVSSPTVFPMARGAGLMGEAGPEAVLPLKRGTDGRLGVASGGGGGMGVTVIDQRTYSGSEPVETTETTGPDGQRMLQVLVRDSVRGSIKSGDLDKSMRDSFGVSRQLTRR